MTISSHIEHFYGLPIEQYDEEKGIQNSDAALRVSVDFDSEVTLLALLEKMRYDPRAAQIKAIVIGEWEEAYEADSQEYLDFLIKHAASFPSLKAIFIGEMTYEENEISWIVQGNYELLWGAYPELEELTIRGGLELKLGDTISHANLKKLVIQTGGLEAAILDQLAKASFPALEHLEVWLGSDDYGWDGNISDVLPLLSAAHFPKLTYLGIKNSLIQDDILKAALRSDILAQLHTLDMSMGVLADDSAAEIITYQDKLQGKTLDVSQNYLSDEMVATLQQTGLTIDVSEQDSGDDPDDRYVSVSE
uniref:STM4015 family protein n=1 Tax=Thaumasiovibrio occultus TaxID=1891184 RepID=UPI000B34FEE1|nr:STM4015 family protein [Thaumasiovibrio occultus]